MAVLIVGGPAGAAARLTRLVDGLAGGSAIAFEGAESCPAGLERIRAGSFEVVVVYDELTGRLLLRELDASVPTVCLAETAADRSTARSRLRDAGASVCIFADELSGPLLEAAILHAADTGRETVEAPRDVDGIVDRNALLNAIDRALARSEIDPAYRFSLVWLDAVPLAGLEERARHVFSERLHAAAGSHTLGRLAPYEYAVLIEPVNDADDLPTIDAVTKAAAQPVGTPEEPIYVDVAIGVVRGRARDSSAEATLDRARARAKVAKVVRSDSASLSGSHHAATAVVDLESALQQGLDRGEFSVAYQPIVEVAKGRLRGFEALVRWNHPDGGERSAADFVPAAERSELIVGIGYWVLEAAARQMAQWEQEFDLAGDVAMSINLSARQVTDPLLLGRVRSLLMTTGLTPSALCFEIQSASVMDHRDEATALIHGLHRAGTRVWIEDFDQDNCDVDHLRGLPISALKAGRDIVGCLDGTSTTSGRLRHILDAAHAMNVDVIAQGVENELQVNVLKWLGCKIAQGYRYARPMPVGDAYAYLARR